MSKFESAPEHQKVKNFRFLSQRLVTTEFIWKPNLNQNMKEVPLTSKLTLSLIIEAASSQGYLSGLGNLEKILIQLADATDSDADLNGLKEHCGISDQPSPADILSHLEQLVTATGNLSLELQDSYLQNIERQYTQEIMECDQDPARIRQVLKTITQRALSTGIENEKINDCRADIEAWAYIPQTT